MKARRLIGLLGLSNGLPFLSGRMATAVGVMAILAMVAAGIERFVRAGMSMSRHSELDKRVFALSPELEADVRSLKQTFRGEFTQGITMGVALCVLSPAPLVFGAIAGVGKVRILLYTALLLLMVAAGVFLFVKDGVIMGSFGHVLQEGEYAVRKKLRRNFKLSNLFKNDSSK